MVQSIVSAMRLPTLLGVLLFFGLGVTTRAQAQTVNQRPTISGAPPTWVYVGSQYYFRAQGYDPEGATLRYSIQNRPSWATFSSSTGVLSGTPTAVGMWSDIRITVSDGVSTSSALLFSIRAARRDNVAPVISGTPATSVAVGSAYSFAPTASDENRDPLRFSIINRPSWATFSSTSGRLSGTPTAANVGAYANIEIRVSDGRMSRALPRFTITVTGSSTNRAPTISGAPAASVTVGQAYSFRPTAADADNHTLGFSIQNRPAWATFSSVTGQLSGTPSATSVGAYSNIVISVSDGRTSTALAPFAISVVDVSNGAATLTWMPPTTNTDGTSLTTLAGYRIAYGTSAASMTQTIQLANAGLSSYVVENLAPGTYYFAVRAYTSSGAESANSNVATKVVQ